ncbi:protein of unknown function [Hyphomicrobium sp. MC1]|nr:protein of unknown function [Hyphomicrobium sp. MC1]
MLRADRFKISECDMNRLHPMPRRLSAADGAFQYCGEMPFYLADSASYMLVKSAVQGATGSPSAAHMMG